MIKLSETKRIVAEVLGIDEDILHDDIMLEELEDWDSVNAVRLILNMESELGVRLSVEQVIKARSLHDIQSAASEEAVS
ncbi:acyl carrier protein [Paenibacillus sp. An7]|uniref:acyl carrier protein n=1 Tax=Paenibacillus sp. An7 TaxID=2689577 RepID=UPI00135B1D6E|nr:acyl carrier protein [Paenibacillus sp. An7]